MASLNNCFVDRVVEPLVLIDVASVPVASSSPQESERQDRPQQPRRTEAKTLQQLTEHLQHSNYLCRLISICQRNSYRPLQISRPMMDSIVSSHEIEESFWELPSCFYTRNLDLEEVHCVSYTETRNGDVVEISYSIKYPEYKPTEDKWVIRQSGIWHRYDSQTSQSTYLLLSPTPDSRAHRQAEEWLLSPEQNAENEPFWLHRILFAAYLPAWRQYIAALERNFLPVANSTFASFIDEPLRIGYDNLSALISLETRFLQVPAVLETTSETLLDICSLITSISTAAAHHPGTLSLRNHIRKCRSYSRTASHLQQRTQITARLLADTLSFRDQVVAKEQNGNMLQLNKSAVFITTLTLLYLPASFVASFFGMNFFDFDGEGNAIVGTPMVWIYVVSSAMLTVVTFLFYYLLLHQDTGVFRALAPKVRAGPDRSLKNLTRRLTSNAKDAAVELQSSKV
ncbi:hypothetical protein B0T14DRAFT_4413 [Immersiella caudata]|uniref:CorA-like transporter domain-containing protein n=1 Tax=Immersiella caudata TaxID=314043 RepID=A0AA39XD89_9PEZI|nr:hypothetical protein B0T14DRAFT_4413 [Immersiella caudata]